MPPVQKPKQPLRRHFLRQWREHRGYTQEQAAEMIGIDRTNLSKIERQQVPYNQALLERAAEAYHCEPADLIMRDPTRGDAPWSILEQLKPALRNEALDYLRFLKEKQERDNNDKGGKAA